MSALKYACILSLIICFFLLLNRPLVLKDPPVWTDESFFASTAYSLATRGYLGTELYKGLLQGAEHHSYEHPPFYYVLLSPVTKAVGLNIEALRWFSIGCGATTICILFLLSKAVTDRAGPSLLACIFLSTDPLFLFTCRVVRPDASCIALITASVWLYTMSIDHPGRKAYLILTGVCLGLAIMSHPLGIIAGLPICGMHIYKVLTGRAKLKDIGLLLLPLFVFLAGWSIYISQDYPSFKAQMLAQFARKEQLSNWLPALWRIGNLRTTFLLYSFAAGYICFRAASYRNKRFFLLALVSITSILLALIGKEMWYPAYYAPFCSLAVAIVCFDFWKKSSFLKSASIVIGGLLLCVNMLYYMDRYAAARDFDYFAMCRDIEKELKEDAMIYLCSIPDTYFSLISSSKNLRIRGFHPLASLDATRTIIEEADYILINPPESRFRSILPTERISRKILIGGQSQKRHQLLLYELIPGDDVLSGNRETSSPL